MNAHQLQADLRAAEDELQALRGRLATVLAFIHDTPGHYKARRALAQRLGLPAPRAKHKEPTP